MQKKAAYEKASAAVKMIEESTEKDYLLENDQNFRDHYESLLACKKWYETRTQPYEDPRPYPVLSLPHDYYAPRLGTKNKPIAVRLGEVSNIRYRTPNEVEMYEPERRTEPKVKKREDPGCFTTPCLINGVPFDGCVLDLGASKSVMPLHVSREVLMQKLDGTNSTLTLADWSTIEVAGIARDVPVILQGHTVPTDFLVIDTKGKSDKIIFGRPFLSSAGAEIKVREGIVDFQFDGCTKRVRIWRDPDPGIVEKPFDPIKANFLQDLAAATRKRVNPLEESLGIDPGIDEPPDLGRLELLDEAGPSSG